MSNGKNKPNAAAAPAAAAPIIEPAEPITNGSNGAPAEQPAPEQPAPVAPYVYEPKSETLNEIRAARSAAKKQFATANDEQIEQLLQTIANLNDAEKTEISALNAAEMERVENEKNAIALMPLNELLNAYYEQRTAPTAENVDTYNKMYNDAKLVWLGGNRRKPQTVATAAANGDKITGDAIVNIYKQHIAAGMEHTAAYNKLLSENNVAVSTAWHAVDKYRHPNKKRGNKQTAAAPVAPAAIVAPAPAPVA